MIKHTFRGLNGVYSRCGVQTFRSDGRLIVMLTELPDNPGTSITNCFELLATSIVRSFIEFNLVPDPHSVRWIEHYARRPAQAANAVPDDWDEVFMQWDGEQYRAPHWQPFNGDRYRTPILGDPCHQDLIAALFNPH